ncbi:hypothetical protein D3C87_1523930 [compost metagenome]
MPLPGRFCRFNCDIVKLPLDSVDTCFKMTSSLVFAVTMNGPVAVVPTIVPEMDVALFESGVVMQTSGPFWPMYFPLTKLLHSSLTVETVASGSILQPVKPIPSVAQTNKVLAVFMFDPLWFR